jgi:hypothetical protein
MDEDFGMVVAFWTFVLLFGFFASYLISSIVEYNNREFVPVVLYDDSLNMASVKNYNIKDSKIEKYGDTCTIIFNFNNDEYSIKFECENE